MQLVRTLSGEGPTIALDVAEDFRAQAPATLRLRLRLNEWTKEDVVRVCWDEVQLEPPQINYCRLDNPTPPGGAFQPPPRWRDISDVSSAVWLSWDLTNLGVTSGAHAVQIALCDRHPQIAASLMLTDVELVVHH